MQKKRHARKINAREVEVAMSSLTSTIAEAAKPALHFNRRELASQLTKSETIIIDRSGYFVTLGRWAKMTGLL
jgi:hypothetical protein